MDSGLSVNPNENPNLESLNISAADLPSAVTLLDDLASAAETTLRSFSALLSPFSCSSTPELFSSHDNALVCPYDSHHRMPPEQLFRHSLRCPSAPGTAIPELIFLEAARYPASLKSEAEHERENTNRFSSPEPGATDLCLSLDGELGEVTAGGAGFFYRDCPGVVSFPEPDPSRSIFTIPRILFVHCDDFKGCTNGEKGDLVREPARILPSELWALKREVAAWDECPSSYSFAVLQSISCLDALEGRRLRDWVISASCNHGILLDCAMGDHIFVLLKLCLKAISSEAATTLDKLSAESQQPELSCFDCPCLFDSISWLASILSILYGNTSGRSFSIDMLKEAVLQSASISMIFKNNAEVLDDSIKGCKGDELERQALETYGLKMCHSPVYVSQVAAAVTALHERSLIETKIRELRLPPPHNKTQILIEHGKTSIRADEERSRRLNYRAIVDHDGIIGQLSSNKGQNKSKTKEELLAEERDYKRRRMSYRGKKNKRNPYQVLHDIIEEHMEEINRAGGIASPTKISVDARLEHLEPSPQGISISYTDHSSRKRPFTEDNGSCWTPKDSRDLELTFTSYSSREHEEKRCKYDQNPGKDSRRSHDGEGERETYYKPQSHSDDRSLKHHTHEQYEQSGSLTGKGKDERSYYSNRSAENGHSSHGKITRHERRFEDYGHSSFKDRYDPSSSSDIHDSYQSYSSKRRYHKSNGQ